MTAQVLLRESNPLLILFTALIAASATLSCNGDQISPADQPHVQISVSKLAVEFGDVQVGRATDQTVEIKNNFSVTQSLEGTISVTGQGFSILRGGGIFKLAPGETRTVTVRFLVTTAGSYSGTLRITHNALNTSNPINIQLSAGKQSSPNFMLTVDPATLDFGQVTISYPQTRSVTISNPSNSTGPVSGTVGVSGVGFSISLGGGSFQLFPGQSRTVIVRFVATSSGTFTGNLDVSPLAPDTIGRIHVPLSGATRSEAVSSLEAAPTTIDFGSLSLGQTREERVTITNPSSSSGRVSGIIGLSFSTSGFTIGSGGGSFNLGPGESRVVSIKFTPVAGVSYTGALQISHNASLQSSPVMVSLRGTGVRIVTMSVDPMSLDFGTVPVGRALEQTITFGNDAASTGSLSGHITISGTGFTIMSGGGSYTLSRGQSQRITVRFSPSAGTSYTGTVLLNHNATSPSSPVRIALTGRGESPPSLTLFVSPSVIEFGDVTVGQSTLKTFVLTNSPTSPGTIAGSVAMAWSAAGFAITEGEGSYLLSPGQSKAITVRFTPVMLSAHGGTINVWHNAANLVSPVSVTLRGSGR